MPPPRALEHPTAGRPPDAARATASAAASTARVSTTSAPRSGRSEERGTASLAQTVLVAPALLFTIMLIVQFGLLFHARSVAENAAQSGAAETRRYDGNAEAGRAMANRYLDQVASETLRGRRVSVSRDTQTATVRVTGTVASLVPGVDLRVSESASGPVERYVPPSREFTQQDNP